MSSHHIVRDNQEPALFIDAPIYNFELIGQLLEWSPILIVNVKYIDWIVVHNLKPDIILSEEKINSAQKEKYKANWFSLEIATGDILKNLTSLLKKRNQTNLTWFCDEFIFKKNAKFILENNLHYNLLSNNKRCVFVTSKKFLKFLNKGVYTIIGNKENIYLNSKKITANKIKIETAKTILLESEQPYFFCEILTI